MRELALRHPAAPDRRDKAGTGPAGTGSAGSAPAAAAPAGGGQPAADERVPVSEFAADEVAFGLRMTWTARRAGSGTRATWPGGCRSPSPRWAAG